MALFFGNRDASVMRKFMKEVVIDLVDTRVAVYKYIVQETSINIYGESKQKMYYEPIRVPALISHEPQESNQEDYTQDVNRTAKFAFIRDYLSEIDLAIETGDILGFDGQFWEVDNVIENQYWGGKNHTKAFSGADFGENVSIIAETHATRLSKIQIVEYRSGINQDDIRELPDGI